MNSKKIFIYVLGSAQDGGYPHFGCRERCCESVWEDTSKQRFPSSLALVDMNEKKYWLFDVTPEVKNQVHMLDQFNCSLAGVFITHAHVGHYMGLINFGLEILNTKKVPVYVMPRMKDYIESSSIFNQLINNENINLTLLSDNKIFNINRDLSIKPFKVPHRNELSETVGFQIIGNKKSVIYLPDIDSWDGFESNLFDIIKSNDILFIDGTFYSKDEIKNRDMSKIPHPEIIDTMHRLSDLSNIDKKKIHFIHFNHTNHILNDKIAYNKVIGEGFSISQDRELFYIN